MIIGGSMSDLMAAWAMMRWFLTHWGFLGIPAWGWIIIGVQLQLTALMLHLLYHAFEIPEYAGDLNLGGDLEDEIEG